MRTFKLVLFTLVLVLGLTGISFGQERQVPLEHSQGSLRRWCLVCP